ncbi:MAG: hypothetical protein F6K22_06110 [Okeania sp. SIO2F4]|uniref:hypothetical protein n=1 Tax=Okeania sp. SIO2F4 TaxID=2607790 RepID=UPI0014297654|nr:hypothetical protein [Okeania sp. SIO2F4]NES02451.1 hypothetical protein [Okeania sp. SIO2F4]
MEHSTSESEKNIEYSAKVAENLRDVWNDVWNIFEPDNSWKDDQSKRTMIQQKLVYFSPKHSEDVEHIDKVIKAVTRGVALTQAAVDWKHPTIGDESCYRKKGRTAHEKFRGFQWRLVIAYSGFEITYKGLMNYFEKGTNLNIIHDFINKCNLPTYQKLEPPIPKQKSNLQKWLSKEDEAIAEFLGVNDGDKTNINQWLVKSQAVCHWEEAFKLAKALRNTTAHGFLQPTKVGKWKLKNSFRILADNLAEIMTYGLRKLV